MIEVVGAMVEEKRLGVWEHCEPKRLKKVGEHLLHQEINFDNLKPLRIYIKTWCNGIPQMNFIGFENQDIDFTCH